jgi:hypothetical protein
MYNNNDKSILGVRINTLYILGLLFLILSIGAYLEHMIIEMHKAQEAQNLIIIDQIVKLEQAISNLTYTLNGHIGKVQIDLNQANFIVKSTNPFVNIITSRPIVVALILLGTGIAVYFGYNAFFGTQTINENLTTVNHGVHQKLGDMATNIQKFHADTADGLTTVNNNLGVVNKNIETFTKDGLEIQQNIQNHVVESVSQVFTNHFDNYLVKLCNFIQRLHNKGHPPGSPGSGGTGALANTTSEVTMAQLEPGMAQLETNLSLLNLPRTPIDSPTLKECTTVVRELPDIFSQASRVAVEVSSNLGGIDATNLVADGTVTTAISMLI